MNDRSRPSKAAPDVRGANGTSLRDLADVAREAERKRRQRLAADLHRVARGLEPFDPDAADMAMQWAVEIGKGPVPADPHCCGALDAEAIAAASRRQLSCGPTSCVRRELGRWSA